MRITDWPLAERPREKLLQKGAPALSDAELLAIFLRVGNKQSDAVDLARDLLQKFSNLQNLVDADVTELQKIEGIGQAKCAQIKAAMELSCRYLEATLKAERVISDSRQTRNYLMSRLKGYQNEVFACLFLDVRHRIIRYEELFNGTVDSAPVYAREIVRKALSYNAAAIILCHNHPSGSAKPSSADKSLTHRLKQALSLIDVRVLDHIIVGDGQTFSFVEHGLL